MRCINFADVVKRELDWETIGLMGGRCSYFL